MSDAESDFYKSFRDNIRAWVEKEGKGQKWAEYILLAPDLLHLLCRLAIDPEVPTEEKAKLAVAIAYIISPIDLIPEALVGRAGYLDDVAVAAYALHSILKATKPEVLKRHWAGDEDLLAVVQKVLNDADEMLGSGLWRRLKEKMETAPKGA
jgi:uncharacterized membrane protein YkvA (DUF1232 family)